MKAVRPVRRAADAGVPLADALWKCAADQKKGMLYRILSANYATRLEDEKQFGVVMSSDDIGKLGSLHFHLDRELLSQLQTGTLTASGVWDADRDRGPIRASMLIDAQIDYDQNEITMPGHVVRAVRVTLLNRIKLVDATTDEIRAAIRAAYAHAPVMQPPNLVDIYPAVKKRLAEGYRTATKRQIQEIADEEEFRAIRRASGSKGHSKGHSKGRRTLPK